MNSRQKKLKKGKRYKKEEYKKVMIMASQLLLLVVLEIGVTEGAALQHVVNGDEEELCSVGAQSKSKNKNKKKIHRKRRKMKNNINFSFTFTTTIESFFFWEFSFSFFFAVVDETKGLSAYTCLVSFALCMQIVYLSCKSCQYFIHLF